jgi:ATP-binding cassette subfamily B (MDR/TAP) protein 1
MKYYKPTSGDILIDGHSIQTLDAEWLRQNVTLVQQQSALFNETVYQNIAFGREGHATMEDVLNASKTGDLQQTITDLPEGLSTLVGSNREPLSGGQQQRIAIARARLRGAPILILDEATCALDQTSKRKAMEEIRKWREKKTTIVITHDASQIHDDEYVYVLDHGNLVQEGYRGDFAEKEHGTFVSFHPVYARGNSTVLEQKRKSEPTSPTCLPMGDIDEILGVCWNRPSHKFGMHESGPQSSNVNSNLQRNRNLSQDVQAFSTNELNLSQQAIPVPPAEIFQSPRLGYFRLNALGFLSPCNLSRASFQDLPRRSRFAERGSMNLPVAEYAIMAEAGKGRPIPSTINTSAIKHQSSPLRVEQGVTSPASTAQTPKKPLKTTPAPYIKVLKSIWPTLSGKERIFFVLGFSFAFIVAAATPAFAYVFARLLGIYYLENDRVSQAKLWALALVGISIVDGVATFCTHYLLEHSGQAWVNSLRVEAFKRILAQPRSWFEIEENSAARLSECLDRNAEEMRNPVGRFAGPIFTTIWMLGISIVWAFLISWKLSLSLWDAYQWFGQQRPSSLISAANGRRDATSWPPKPATYSLRPFQTFGSCVPPLLNPTLSGNTWHPPPEPTRLEYPVLPILGLPSD